MVIGKIFKYLFITFVTLGVLVAIGFFLGVFGIPTLNSIDNEFGTVNETTTEIRTNVSLNNPNPIGVSFGGLEINYTVLMNDVAMANGQKNGVSIGTGNTSIELVTYLDNTKIPAWWYTHIQNNERTDVTIDATVSQSTLGSTNIQEDTEIETDILSSFNSTETRPIDANKPVIQDPVLYLNETSGSYGDGLTRDRTPINLDLTVYNPKRYPYTITEIGYTINMNDVEVGNGTTESEQILEQRSQSQIEAETAIRNQRLDKWWVTHIENNETTELYVDFYIVVDPGLSGVDPIRLDSDELDYEDTIETNILGNKNQSSTGTDGSDGTSDADATATATPEDGSSGPLAT